MKGLLTIGFVAALAWAARPASAQDLVDFDESGNATITTIADTVPLLFSAAPGSTTPLIYHLGFPRTPGDVVADEQSPGVVIANDPLRWDANGNPSLYSDMESTNTAPVDLADVSQILPPSANALRLEESDPSGIPVMTEGGTVGLLNYRPGLADPGGLPIGGVITHNFTSDAPKPASLGLFGLAIPALLVRPHRRT